MSIGRSVGIYNIDRTGTLILTLCCLCLLSKLSACSLSGELTTFAELWANHHEFKLKCGLDTVQAPIEFKIQKILNTLCALCLQHVSTVLRRELSPLP
jgi:hypothetical protein